LTDEELISGCLSGRKESWDAFVGRFSKLIHWSVRKTLGQSPLKGRPEICEDVFQDVFHRLLDRDELAKLKEMQSLRKFLSVMACHAALDRIKSLRRLESKHDELSMTGAMEDDLEAPKAFISLEDPAGSNPSLKAISNEHEKILRQTLEVLKPKERAVIEFFYLEGMPARVIGELLGFTDDGVWALLRRTKEKLKKALLKQGMEEPL